MKNNISTAGEYLNGAFDKLDDSGNCIFYRKSVENLLVEFAQLHLDAQAKAIYEEAINSDLNVG